MEKAPEIYAKEIADKFGFECEIFYHEDSGKTTSQAEEALGLDPKQIIKCLLLKSGDNYLAAIVRGSDKLDFSKLEEISQYKEIRMANGDDIRRELGFEIGGVPAVIFAEKGIKTFVDRKLLDLEYVVGSGGTEHHGMKFNPKYLIDKLNYQVSDISQNV